MNRKGDLTDSLSLCAACQSTRLVRSEEAMDQWSDPQIDPPTGRTAGSGRPRHGAEHAAGLSGQKADPRGAPGLTHVDVGSTK